jgi:threonine/homoserine/homoserine lactone efflux protein
VFAASLLGSPGPATVSLAASGAAIGRQRSLPFLGGIITGWFINLVAVVLGLAVLFTRFPEVEQAFKVASLVYIVYLAWKIATSGAIGDGEGHHFRYVSGVLLNLLNPKAYIAATAIVTQFTVFGRDHASQVATVVATSLLVALVTQFGWIVAGDLLSHLFRDLRLARVLNGGMALLMVLTVLLATFA